MGRICINYGPNTALDCGTAFPLSLLIARNYGLAGREKSSGTRDQSHRRSAPENADVVALAISFWGERGLSCTGGLDRREIGNASALARAVCAGDGARAGDTDRDFAAGP